MVSKSLRGRQLWTERVLVILPLWRRPVSVVGGRAAGILVKRISLRARSSMNGVLASMMAQAHGVSGLRTLSIDFRAYAAI